MAGNEEILPPNDEGTMLYIVFFVNSSSGGKNGGRIAELKRFNFAKAPHVQMYVFNIMDKQARLDGVAQVKDLLATLPKLEKKLQVWSGGGDGTVTWLIQILEEHGIDVGTLTLAHLPFGTGNDFSQAIGWENAIDSGVDVFVRYALNRINHGTPVAVDIWEISFKTYPDGYVRRMVEEQPDVPPTDTASPGEVADGMPVRAHSRFMSDFFALGLEAWIASNFASRRTNSRLGNFSVYLTETGKRTVTGVPPVTRVLEGIEVAGRKVLSSPEPDVLPSLLQSPIVQAPVTVPRSIAKGVGNIIKSAVDAVASDPETKAKKLYDKLVGESDPSTPAELKADPVEIAILNFKRIWARPINFWDEPLVAEDLKVTNRSGPISPANWRPSLVNDGKLEVVAMKSFNEYVAEVANPRNLARIGQLGPTFRLTFRHAKTADLGLTYCIIDGDTLELVHVQYIEFTRKYQPLYIAKRGSGPAMDQAELDRGVVHDNTFLYMKEPSDTVLTSTADSCKLQ